MPQLPPSGPSPSADALFAAWLAGRDAGEEVAFEELLGEHPEHTARLRELHGHWAALERLSERGPSAGRYRLEGEIGRGGMGAVMRVWEEDLQRSLAMKVLLGPGRMEATGDAAARELPRLARFLEEAQVTGQLDHPGIVPVHEIGLDAGGRVFFAMKLVKGKSG